jgi:hypothetical protein
MRGLNVVTSVNRVRVVMVSLPGRASQVRLIRCPLLSVAQQSRLQVICRQMAAMPPSLGSIRNRLVLRKIIPPEHIRQSL